MQRRGFFGFIAGLAAFLPLHSARATTMVIPPLTGLKQYTTPDGSMLWNIDWENFKSRQIHPNHRPEMFRSLNRAPYIQHAERRPDVQRLIDLPEGASPLHDHPRSHMKLPPVDPNSRIINAGYLPGTEPADTFPA